MKLDKRISKRFNRINSGRSIPTGGKLKIILRKHKVSIVSIQADQSRRLLKSIQNTVGMKFQSYQFRQINPDSIILTIQFK